MPRPRTQPADSSIAVKPFRELRASGLNANVLREHVAAYGYALVRNLLFPKDLNLLLTEIVQTVSAAGWLDPSRPPLDRIAKPGVAFDESDPAFRRVSDRVFSLEAFHAFPHHPSLKQMMEFLVGPHLLVHPRPIPRLVFPNADRYRPLPRQDHYAIGGDTQTYTAWIPLHDCLPKLGPIQILEGSHRYGLQRTAQGTGTIPLESARGDAWVGGRVDAGDVLLFHSLAVHTASPNTSGQLRISLDCRFQSYDRPVNPANLVFPPAGERTWANTYAYWRSARLKHYWKQLPLHFNPSLTELAQLADTAESPESRARYHRILSQLEAQTQPPPHSSLPISNDGSDRV